MTEVTETEATSPLSGEPRYVQSKAATTGP
jgi:hypothetical protein